MGDRRYSSARFSRLFDERLAYWFGFSACNPDGKQRHVCGSHATDACGLSEGFWARLGELLRGLDAQAADRE